MSAWEWLSGVTGHKTNRRHLSRQASLSFHCQYIPCTHYIHTIHTTQQYTLYTNTCVYHTPDIVLSKCPKPSMVAVSCDVVCVLLCSIPARTIGWNASNLEPNTLGRYSQYTPDTLESIFSLMLFLRMSLHICQLMTINNWMECFKSRAQHIRKILPIHSRYT